MAGSANFSGVIGCVLLEVLVVTLIATTGKMAQIEILFAVIICTARFNIHQFYLMPTQCVYVFCVDLENKQRLFPYTALTDWIL
jgi:hypothetical protein